ncbi:malate:quinone oxidoreductase, partial [Nocardia farcinica]|uniref:malate:quinone oxidoreductase n=1 Tax=Nocardia farcinica TaxID=37329 RepID=UPI0024551A9D
MRGSGGGGAGPPPAGRRAPTGGPKGRDGAGRDFSDPIAQNWTDGGTDIDFGSHTKELLAYLGATRAALAIGPPVAN